MRIADTFAVQPDPLRRVAYSHYRRALRENPAATAKALRRIAGLCHSRLARPALDLMRRAMVSSKLRSLAFARKSYSLRQRIFPSRRPHGVNLVAYIRAEMGLGEAGRGMASVLESAGVPFRVYNFEAGNPSSHANLSWSHKEGSRAEYDVTLLCVGPDNLENVRAYLPNRFLNNRYVIAYWFWELPEFPEEWTRGFELVSEIWAGSGFVQESVALKSPAPVVRVPPVVRIGNTRLPRGYFLLPENRFLFLSACDTFSVLERKNPLGVIRAYLTAFPREDPRVGLVLKFNNPSDSRLQLENILSLVAGRNDIHIINKIFARDEIDSLIAACDSVVSLHRAEGFGLVPAEAMSLGKPVIITAWSGNVDYMTPDNCAAIGYKLVPLGRDYGLYKAHQYWAEPDLDQAAHWMRRLVEEPGLCLELGRRAQETMTRGFSPEAVGTTIRKRLEYIRRNSL